MAAGRKTGGRSKGTPNRATAEVKELARRYGPAALAELARLMTEAESEAARVAACREILDRAYGKPTQPLSGDPEGVPIQLQQGFVDRPPPETREQWLARRAAELGTSAARPGAGS